MATQGQSLQVTKTKRKSSGRKRISQVAPAIKKLVASAYEACGFDSERVAEDYGVRRVDVVDAYLTELRRGPEPSRPFVIYRRTA